ncbi:MAG: phosphoribosylamine--glycine ligase [Bacillota bacterium]
MNVLVIGSGGREHALAWAVRRSASVRSLYIAPGNPGTGSIGENVELSALSAGDHVSVARFCRDRGIGLVVVGPENPLAEGIADSLRSEGIPVFGPGKAGAMLEAAKTYAKEFMGRHGVPHGAYRSFTDLGEALAHVESTKGPWVMKADGLALGKGVTITSDKQEAIEALKGYFSGKLHGDAGLRVEMEEFLSGVELTAMALTDGKTLFPLPFARDHKRVFDGDKGPMTGGMGAYSPVPLSGERLERAILQDVLQRTLAGLQEEGIDYKGVLYAGLMLTADGPKVLEYNVRFGDPESQCVLPRLRGDIAAAFLACAEGRLGEFLERTPITVSDEACAAIVMASGGYPGSYRKGYPIYGLDEACGGEWAHDPPVFHAGTRAESGQIVTAGGRVLAVPALGQTVSEAGRRAYERVRDVRFEGASFRKDIVDDAV